MGEAGSADRSELEARVRELEAERDALMEVSTHRVLWLPDRQAGVAERVRFLLYDCHTPTSETHQRKRQCSVGDSLNGRVRATGAVQPRPAIELPSTCRAETLTPSHSRIGAVNPQCVSMVTLTRSGTAQLTCV